MFILLVTVILNVYLLVIIPKGFFPQVDEGRIFGNIRGDQSISYQAMQKKFIEFGNIIRADPAVAQLAGSIGGGGGGRGGGATNTGQLFITLEAACRARPCQFRRRDRPAAGRNSMPLPARACS